MRDRILAATQKATEARRNALGSTDPRVKDEWLRIAGMWEELANEYDQFGTVRGQLIRDSALLNES